MRAYSKIRTDFQVAKSSAAEKGGSGALITGAELY
jgi:hypothetical protein